jgi:excisionase family DNA binding protein
MMDNASRPEQPLPELLTSAEAAQLANVGERTWWRWTKEGQAPAPAKLPGRIVRFRRREILAWIDANCPPMSRWAWQPAAGAGEDCRRR